MTEQGIIVLERKRQSFLRAQLIKIYWKNQHIHSLKSGESDSFFVNAGKGHLEVTAGIFGKKTATLDISPTQPQYVFLYLNISALEFWGRMVVTLGAFGLLLVATFLKTFDVTTAGFVLLGVLIANILLNINRLRMRVHTTAEGARQRSKV